MDTEKKEALAVVLGDIASVLSSSKRKKIEGKWGKTCQKDFLRPNSTICKVQWGKNARKRRCFAFFLQYLPSEVVQELRRGK